MKLSLNPNYIKSSNFIFISVGLGLINFLLSPHILSSKSAMIVSIITLSLLFIAGLLVRFQISWIKYLLLALILIGFNSLPSLIKEELTTHPINAIFTILQAITLIYATILLFFKWFLYKRNK
ncbi:hypothetical protein [Flavobacterium sp. PL02]|uniref:hypothetical protein n=1 Tax=Flavobacterium sp. PL02 TaxID=3088354 RepID=UPI002B22A31A|nr:hypothetical protein [Flavobacterium sp. PL02]MEA9413987.1 hypothetical protein [Flavobacterium sp. PL02]